MSVYSLWSIDGQPVDQPSTYEQVMGREVQQVCENVAQVVWLWDWDMRLCVAGQKNKNEEVYTYLNISKMFALFCYIQQGMISENKPIGK